MNYNDENSKVNYNIFVKKQKNIEDVSFSNDGD